MATDMRKVGIGAFLLVVSTALVIGAGMLATGINPLLGGVAALGLAAGALLVGTSEDRRPV